ncbi:DNA-damage-inducible SOS response protein [Bacteroidales bacterium Barb7]|nr:DNA-damage-inducible SOS response protein [Bacteroidales bacterium Barb7]
MNKEILHIAIPAIFSNIAVPLLGLIGIGIVGHLGKTAYIGSMALGTMFFNTIYWIFAFLRMGTSGLTAQAYGRRDRREIAAILVQSVLVSFVIALVLILFRHPVERLIFSILETTAEMEKYAILYIHILIWGAPAVLTLWVFFGWFIGMQNSRCQMYVILSMSAVNVVLSLAFVYGFKMNLDGVAWATLLSQYFGLILAVIIWLHKYGSFRSDMSWKESFRFSLTKRLFTVNRDIFFRMICLVVVTFFFVYAGARQGETILAVNTLMMQLYYMYSFFLDGFSFAGEALIGKYAGAKDEANLHKAVHYLFLWGAGVAVLFTLLYAAGGTSFLGLLTDDKGVINASSAYFYWALFTPLISFTAFIWDGIMIGAITTRYMLISIAGASVVFFSVYYAFSGETNNHILWLAFTLYLFIRGLIQTVYAKKCLSLQSIST